MKKFRKRIFVTAGFNTLYFGPGRKEFDPEKPMPTFEHYLQEATQGTLAQIPNPDFDEGVIGNFMAGRFIKQGNLPGFLPHFVPALRERPCVGVEGACGSGGLALATAVKTVLAEVAESVFVLGFEIQNTLKALYGADVLAGAGYFRGERKKGHAYFFPGIFSERAGQYYEKYGYNLARQAMAHWYELAILNARKYPKAQEYHNTAADLYHLGMTPPNPEKFVPHLNLYDCSKVSDGASSLVILSEAGREKLGVKKENCIEIIGLAQCEADITEPPREDTVLSTTQRAVERVLAQCGLAVHDIGLLELHDCFSITGLLALESIGVAPPGKSAQFILDGQTQPDGKLPVNPSGGLIGFGHPTGATGVRQMVDLWEQFTLRAAQTVKIKNPYGMMISMGGNDKTVTALIVKPVV